MLFRSKATSVVKALPKTRAKSKVYSITSEIKNINDLSSSFAEFANKFPDYFASGFKRIDFERKASNNGSTDRRGNIWLSADRVKKVISGMNNIRKGIATTLDEEDALSTLWHEITHNRNPIPTILTTKQRSYMELANEYVSRKTLPQFLNDLGGDIQNISLLSNRTSTGYNTMVRNYQKLVEITGADESKVLDSVRDHLFNQSYTDQATGLIKAITKNSAIKEGTIKKAVTRCDGLSESGYEKFLKSLFPNK